VGSIKRNCKLLGQRQICRPKHFPGQHYGNHGEDNNGKALYVFGLHIASAVIKGCFVLVCRELRRQYTTNLKQHATQRESNIILSWEIIISASMIKLHKKNMKRVWEALKGIISCWASDKFVGQNTSQDSITATMVRITTAKRLMCLDCILFLLLSKDVLSS
jgi:hypothetical protein